MDELRKSGNTNASFRFRWTIGLSVVCICTVIPLYFYSGILSSLLWLRVLVYPAMIIADNLQKHIGQSFWIDLACILAQYSLAGLGLDFLSWRKRSHGDGCGTDRCTNCGYSQTGLSSRKCPECGKPWHDTEAADTVSQ